jgi:phosphatidylinositol kinase/protein kinase (PI-3  family)
VLSRRKESRKRNLCFHLPAAIPLAPGLRLLENDASYVTLQGIYDQHCIDTEISREEPVLAFTEKMKSIMEPNKPVNQHLIPHPYLETYKIITVEAFRACQSQNGADGRNYGEICTEDCLDKR